MFHKIAIVGLRAYRRIGRAGAVVRPRPACRIVAIDRAAVVSEALGAGAADAGGDDLALADGADLIVLAAPVRQNIGLLARSAVVRSR